MKTKDLSKGRPLALLILFSLPMVLSVVFQQLYNIADSMIAGKMLGTDSLAAVSGSYPITMIYLGVGTGLSVGCGILISRTFGKKDEAELKTTVATSFITMLIAGIVMTVVGYFSAEPFLRLLGTPDEIFDSAAAYLKTYTLGMIFVYIYNACSVAFQSVGNSKIPLFFLIFSTLLNVGLDILFLSYIPRVSSLSTATVIAQGIAAVGSVLVLVSLLHSFGRENEPKKRLFQRIAVPFVSLFKLLLFKKPYQVIRRKVVVDIILIGVPNILHASTVSIGQLFIQNLINGYGTVVIAGYGAAIKISTFLIQIPVAESTALSIFVSQNVGAGTHERIKSGMKSGALLIFMTTAAALAIGLPLSPHLVSLFVEGEAATGVVAVGSQLLHVVMPFYLVLAIKLLFDSLLRGCGSIRGYVISTAADLVVRVGIAYLLNYLLQSVLGVWWSWPIGWAVGAAVAAIFFATGRWKRKIKPFEKLTETVELT